MSASVDDQERDHLVRVARETVEITTRGRYVNARGDEVAIDAAVARAVDETRVFHGAALAALPRREGPPSDVRAWPVRSAACARRLLDEGARRVALLNYASGVSPGGNFLGGASAQEEALCRMSALFACLSSSRNDARVFYEENRGARSALVTDAIAWSPRVPFFRDEELALTDAPFLVDTITCAAPNLPWLVATTSEDLEPRARFDEIPEVFARRTANVVALAGAMGCDALVVGPWGCGAFGNDPELVAEAFDRALSDRGGGLARVVISLWGSRRVCAPFIARFGLDDDVTGT